MPTRNLGTRRSQVQTGGGTGRALAGVLISGASAAAQGGIVGGPVGAVTGALLGAGTALIEHIFAADTEPLQRANRIIRASIEEARWVVGTARVSGAMVYYNERDIEAGADLLGDGGETVTAGIRAEMAIVISENELDRISRIWIDGDEMPLGGTADAREYSSSGFDGRLATLRSELTALGVSTENVDDILGNPLHTPLAADIATEIGELEGSQNDIIWQEIIGDPEVDGENVSLVRIWFDLGGPGVSAADTQAETRRIRRHYNNWRSGYDLSNLENYRLFPTPGQWDGTENQLKGLAWMWVEVLAFTANGRADDDPATRGWRDLPNIQVLAHSARGSNPVDWIEWLLTDRCGVPAADIAGADAARAICATHITIPAVARGDDDVAGKLVHASDVLPVLFPDGVPIVPDIQDRALGVWNGRYAGVGNAEARWQVHGIITSGMLRDTETLLRQLGEAMGGWVVPVGNKYKLVAAAASAVKATVTDDDVVDERVTWLLGPGYEDRISGIRAALPQDARNDYEPLDLGDNVRDDLGDNQYYRMLDVGAIPFQASELAARRLMNLVVRRHDPGLRRGACVLSRGGSGWAHWNLEAGDRIRLNLTAEGVDITAVVLSAEMEPEGGRVAIEFREDPDTIYSDSFDLLPVGTGNTKYTTSHVIGPGDDRPVPSTVTWDNVTERVYDFGWFGTARHVAKQVRNVRTLGDGVLVWRQDDGDWQEIPDMLPQDGTLDPIAPGITQEDGDAGWTFSMLIPPSAQANPIHLTFADRTGSDTDTDPYVYRDAKTVAFVPKSTPLNQANRIVESLPETSTLPEGTLLHVLEDTE